MRSSWLVPLIALLWAPAAAADGAADAADPAPVGDPTADPPAEARTFTDSFGAYQLELGAASAGPLRFHDTPDMTLDPTTVLVVGGRLGVAFGDPRRDNHRLGLAVGYQAVARSEARKLALIVPQLTYETGHPLMLRLALGYAIPSGTGGFADHYGGVYSSASLAWSFLDRGRPGSTVSAALGLTAALIATGDADYTSAYLGGDLSFRFHLGKQGGSR
jgi:hypothetical protein